MNTIIPVKPYQRQYLNPEEKYDTWSKLSPFAEELINYPIDSKEALLEFLNKRNELNIIVTEQDNWLKLQTYRYLKDENHKEASTKFDKEVIEKYEKIIPKLNEKIIRSPYLNDLIATDPSIKILAQNLQNKQKVQSDKNIALFTRINELIEDYNKISGAQKIKVGEEEMHLVKVYSAVKNETPAKRQEYSKKIVQKQIEDAPQIDPIYDEMVQLRHQIAQQAGYDNYQDYIWDEKSRTDFTPADTAKICEAIKDYFIPVHADIIQKRKIALQQDEIYACDLNVPLSKLPPPKFTESATELSANLKQLLQLIHPEFGEMFSYLEEHDRLDLEKRPNKAMALFVYRLPESRLPFVFYNQIGTFIDLSYSLHESTHAIHSLFTNDLALEEFKESPSEVNELFPLSMELIAMEHWDVFLKEEEHLVLAKLKKIESCLSLFKMVALWDSFQHWVYTNPDHSHEERNTHWNQLSQQYDIGLTKPLDIPADQNIGWQGRPLIFRAPFYMISYAIAELGAIEIYRQYRINPKQTINNLIAAMKLGNTRPLKEIYQTAGIQFDISNEYIIQIADFLQEEYNRLFKQLTF